MFPNGDFDELEFRRQMSEDMKMQAILIPLISGGLDTWLSEAKMISEEGF
jgi:hypothetical protein